MIRIGTLPNKYAQASVLGAASGGLTAALLSKVMAQNPLPFIVPDWDQQLVGWLALRLHSIDSVFFPEIAARYQHYLDTVGFPAWQITGRFDLAAIAGLGIAGLVTWLIGRGQPDTQVISGRKLYEGKKAHRVLLQRAKEKCAVSGIGLKLHPSFGWHLSLDQETRHFLIQGSVGGGKSQILWALLNAAVERGDRLVIYDNKGDFTSQLNTDFALLAPWDARSFAWNIAKDCTNDQDARELAARLIPEGSDPMWHSSARMILSAVICKLQAEKPGEWTWSDLYRLACGSQDELLEIVTKYQPEAFNLLAGESKTTDGILINLSASLAIVADLAKAWGSAPPEQRFSFAEWILHPNPDHKVVILQGNGRYSELTKGYIQGIIAMLSGRINSSEVGESKDRKVWLILDEVPQLGKIPGLSSILEVGRSKGVRVVLGTQDLAQLQEIYGQYIGKIWGSLVGTQIIVRTSSGDTANFIAKEMIGYATIEKTTLHEGKAQPSQTSQQLVLEPSDLADAVGADDKGVKAVLLGMHDAHILHWPYTTMPKRREAGVSARWTHGQAGNAAPEQTMNASAAETVINGNASGTAVEIVPAASQPKLKLRQPTRDEIMEMAESGSDIADAADPIDEMDSDLPQGDNK